MKIPTPCFVLAALLFCGSVSGETFSPAPLKLSAPSVLNYQFDGTELRIPVRVSGTPATVYFFVFTRDKYNLMNSIRNGYLGWHYVNKIDTCCSVSPPYQFATGENTIVWNGRDKNGRRMYPGDVTFYLWGYDSSSPPKKVTDRIRFPRFDRSFIQTLDSSGKPLERPVLYDAPQTFNTAGESAIVRTKWVIGGDASDPSLAETTRYRSWVENSRIALDPVYTRYFFTQSLRPDRNLVMSKWEWAPNGEAILQADWSDNGYCYFPSSLDVGQPLYSGPVGDGNGILFFVNRESTVRGDRCFLYYVDEIDGALFKTADLTTWWADGTGTPRGPSAMSFTGGTLFLNSPLSPVVMMLDPYIERESDLVQWENGNGDGVGDKTISLDCSDPRACADPAQTPVAGATSTDRLRFSLFPVEGVNAASFGVFAPDGTGIGSFPLPGMEEGSVYGLHVVDSGSAYDGIYYGGISPGREDTGVRFTAHDSFKGIISFTGGDQFGPGLSIKDPGGGDILVPGSKAPIIWDAWGLTFVRIEFSPDNGAAWTTVADSVVASAGSYLWTVPDISSHVCRIRITENDNPERFYLSGGLFTIDGTSGVAEGSRPHTYAVSSHPNPFNPSTTISFTLPAPGKTTLTVYDITGRKVRTLVAGTLPAGTHSTVWDGRDERGNAVSSGVYLSRLESGKAANTIKMLLMK